MNSIRILFNVFNFLANQKKYMVSTENIAFYVVKFISKDKISKYSHHRQNLSIDSLLNKNKKFHVPLYKFNL